MTRNDQFSNRSLNEILIYISYATDCEESLKIVDQLAPLFEEKGIPVIRDKRDERYKRFLSRFSQSLGYGDYIILIVGDRFLKSDACMYELIEISKSNRYQELIFPVILKDAKIRRPINRLTYIHYWEKRIKNLEKKMKLGGLANITDITDGLDNYKEIRKEISSLIENLNSRANKFDNDLQTMFNDIERKIETDKKSTRFHITTEIPHFEEGKKYKYYADRIKQFTSFQYSFLWSEKKVQFYFIHGESNQSPIGLYKRIYSDEILFNKDESFCLDDPIELRNIENKDACETDLLVNLFRAFNFPLGSDKHKTNDKNKWNIGGLASLPTLKRQKYVLIGIKIENDEWGKCLPELLNEFFATILNEKNLYRKNPKFIFVFLLYYPERKKLQNLLRKILSKFSRKELFKLDACSKKNWLDPLNPVYKKDIIEWFKKYVQNYKKEKYMATYFKGGKFKMIYVEEILEKILKDYYQKNKENTQND